MEFLPFLDYIYHAMVVIDDQDLPFLDYVDHVMVIVIKTCPFWMT